MKIIVCIKQVPSSNEVRLDPVRKTIIRDSSQSVTNPFDVTAAEAAVRIREKLGGTVTAISMGIPATERLLRDEMARGVDKAVLLTDRRFAGADTLVTARCLKKAAEFLGPADLITCGRRAADGETGQVGPMLASMLDWPCLYNLTSAEAGESVRGRQLTESAERDLICRMPAVLTFCEWSYRLRLPTLKGLRNAGKTPVTHLSPEEIGIAPELCGLRASPTRVVHVDTQPTGARPCRKMTAGQVMDAVLGHYPEIL